MAVKAGQMLDRYKVIEQIGSGAFGSVWLAEDTWLAKRVALKIPHDQKTELTKLLLEPKVLAALEHPGIIKLLTVEKVGDVLFMVMELAEGKSLRDLLREGSMSVEGAVKVARGILEALAYAHQKGVIHRDLKPANILITPSGQVKLMDFGTAHSMPSGEETVAAGTLFYMSKEQLLGRVTPASDIYSVGVLMFEMLTGKLPFFDDSGGKLIQRILSDERPPEVRKLAPAVPPELALIVQRALEKDYRKRWKRAEEMLAAIDAWKAGKPIPDAVPPVTASPPGYAAFIRKVPKMVETLGKTHEFTLKATIGGRGKADGQFMLPAGIAVGASGRVYVSDAIRGCVQLFDPDGKYIKRLGSDGGLLDQGLRFANPTAVAVDRAGLIYTCDTKNCRVQVFNEGEEVIRHFGRPLIVVGIHEEQGVIGLNYPRGIALDEEEGVIYVADSGNSRVRLFSMEGKPVQTFGTRGDRPSEFNVPHGMAVGAQGRLYVADSQNYRIQLFDKGFRFVECIGRKGTKPGEFAHPPVGVQVTINGEILVSDESDTMHIFGEDGAFLGGITGLPGQAGTAKYAGAAFWAEDSLYAIDNNNCQVHHFAYREKGK